MKTTLRGLLRMKPCFGVCSQILGQRAKLSLVRLLFAVLTAHLAFSQITRPDPLVDVEVLEEITPLEYEARRRAANSDENLPDTNFQRGTSYVGFKLKDLWTSALQLQSKRLCFKREHLFCS